MSTGTERYFGWIRDELGFRAYAASLPAADDFWDALRAIDDGGDRFYYRALALSIRDAGLADRWLKDGRIRALDQLRIGACVGNAEAKRASHMAALDVYLRLEAETFRGFFSPEWSYYASRKQSNLLHTRGDGSTGFGAAKAAVAEGMLVQGMYGSMDVSVYSEDRCREWGNGNGIPTDAIAEAAAHRYGSYAQADNAEKIWLASGAGLIFNVCSDQGFVTVRDADGACTPRGTWMHSMCGGSARYTTKKGRKLVLIDNSWGDNGATGPFVADQPHGTFYADLDVVGDMAAQGDTFVDRGYVGHRRIKPPASFTEM